VEEGDSEALSRVL